MLGKLQVLKSVSPISLEKSVYLKTLKYHFSSLRGKRGDISEIMTSKQLPRGIGVMRMVIDRALTSIVVREQTKRN